MSKRRGGSRREDVSRNKKNSRNKRIIIREISE